MTPIEKDVEILVHVDAPSRVTDDACYRQLANAYLGGRTGERVRIPLHDEKQVDSPTTEERTEPITSPPFPRGEPERLDLTVQESPGLSFTGVFDNRGSPRLATARQSGPRSEELIPSSLPEMREENTSQQLFSAPESQIADSYPLPRPNIYTSPTKVLQRYVSLHTPASPSRSARNPTPTEEVSSETHGSRGSPRAVSPGSSSNRHALPQGDNNAQKVVPETPLARAMHKTLADGVCEDDHHHDLSHITGSDVSDDLSSADCPPRAGSAPPAKRLRSSTQTATTSRPAKLIRSECERVRPPKSPLAESPLHTVLELYPPSPAVSIDPLTPDDCIPPKLAKLARDVSSRYQPTIQRELEPFERGHWLVDCTTWTPHARIDAWNFIGEYFKSGSAGWGVWCRRDKTHDWIKLYCWGCVTKHMYLLLYLASGRALKYTGAQWKDADGEVVIQAQPMAEGLTQG
jgi:hypothetical protein